MTLEKLKQLADKAKSGPWIIDRVDAGGFITNGAADICYEPDEGFGGGYEGWPDNAQYIATMNPETTKKLIALVEMQHEAIKASVKLIASKVISNTMPKEQHKNYDALMAYEQFNTENNNG